MDVAVRDMDMEQLPDAQPDDGTDADADMSEPDADPGPVMLSNDIRLALDKLSPAGGIAPPLLDTTNAVVNDPAAVRLGQWFFYEPSISGNGQISCATCHQPGYEFTDPTPLPEGGITAPDVVPGRRTPTLVNVAYQTWYFWDGRRDTLWGQATGPYESTIEMGGTRLQLAHYVYETPAVKAAYEAIFGPLPDVADLDPFPATGMPIDNPQGADQMQQNANWVSMTPEDQLVVNTIFANVMKTVAAFETRLVSLDAPFDAFVQQMRDNPDDPAAWTAISQDAVAGARLFVDVGGCLECHSGPLMTDGKFHNLGLPAVSYADPADPGRFEGVPQARAAEFSSTSVYSDDTTGQKALLLGAIPALPRDMGAFKTPTLRNVAERPPFMHDGQHADLRATLEFYNDEPEGPATVGTRSSEFRPMDLDDDDLDKLEAFLESLTGQPIPAELTQQPPSPM